MRPEGLISDVVVEVELVGVGAQPDRVDLVLDLVVDPRLDQILGEHPARQQELVVVLERFKASGRLPGTEGRPASSAGGRS